MAECRRRISATWAAAAPEDTSFISRSDTDHLLLLRKLLHHGFRPLFRATQFPVPCEGDDTCSPAARYFAMLRDQ